MEKEIVQLRELQRNYRKLIDRVNRTKKPLYLGAHSRSEAVLLDVESFERLQRQHKEQESWDEVKKKLRRIQKSGIQGINLAEFIHADRHSH